MYVFMYIRVDCNMRHPLLHRRPAAPQIQMELEGFIQLVVAT